MPLRLRDGIKRRRLVYRIDQNSFYYKQAPLGVPVFFGEQFVELNPVHIRVGLYNNLHTDQIN